MRYHNITKDDMSNGTGLRVVLWLSGCNHYCKGCQNPVTWDPNDGLPFDVGARHELFSYLSRDYISGITLSGGDPLYPGNREDVLDLLVEMCVLFPKKDVWMYTGYLWEEVKDLEIMNFVNVLVDGEYKEELRDISYPWAGSTNQRVINVPESLKMGEVVLLETDNMKMEDRIESFRNC